VVLHGAPVGLLRQAGSIMNRFVNALPTVLWMLGALVTLGALVVLG
jgi:hypothetical protein